MNCTRTARSWEARDTNRSLATMVPRKVLSCVARSVELVSDTDRGPGALFAGVDDGLGFRSVSSRSSDRYPLKPTRKAMEPSTTMMVRGIMAANQGFLKKVPILSRPTVLNRCTCSLASDGSSVGTCRPRWCHRGTSNTSYRELSGLSCRSWQCPSYGHITVAGRARQAVRARAVRARCMRRNERWGTCGASSHDRLVQGCFLSDAFGVDDVVVVEFSGVRVVAVACDQTEF